MIENIAKERQSKFPSIVMGTIGLLLWFTGSIIGYAQSVPPAISLLSSLHSGGMVLICMVIVYRLHQEVALLKSKLESQNRT